jgi:PAS domain S-box-containing protein
VVLLGIVFAVAVFTALRHSQFQNIEARFYLDSQDRTNAIKRELGLVDEIVASLKSFYDGSEEVTRDEFNKFTAPLIREHSSIKALQWVPRVRASERYIFEKKAKEEIYPNFQLTEKGETGEIITAGKRGEYFPAYFVEPYKGNEQVAGFDHFSDPEIAGALNMALEGGELVATGKIQLKQEKMDDYSFLLILPVYHKNVPIETVQGRRKHLNGFVLGEFRIRNIIEDALSYIKAMGINLYVYDESDNSERKLLYFHSSRISSASSPDHIAKNDFKPEMLYRQVFNVGNRKWSIESKPHAAYLGQLTHLQYWGLWAFFAVFLSATFIISAYIRKTVDHAAEIENLVGKLSDEITERKKVEKELKLFQKLIHHSNDAIFVIDPETSRFLSSNNKACENLGYSHDELLTMGVIDIEAVLPDNFLWEMHIEEVRDAGFMILEGLHRRKDGTTYPAEINANLVLIGETEYMVSVVRDITERKLVEDELKAVREHLRELVKERTSELELINEELEQEIRERKQAEEEAVRASQLASLGELAAGVAHEINNPINGIINYSQLIVNKNEDGSWDKDIAVRIIKEGDRISNIVTNLLSFARVNDGKMIPARVSDILSEALSLTHTHIRKDGIKLTVDVSPDLPVVHMNSQQIEQVFLNVISNARYALNQKYRGKDNSKKLEILGAHVMNDKPFVRIIFSDNGVGIPPGIKNKIMNPFFTTKPSNMGTGLGLSISHGIISQHDGSITFDSVEGEFTKVMIDLPG